MSRIYFHTRDEGQAELLGSERANMGCIVNDVASSFAPPFADLILPLVKAGHYLHGMGAGPNFTSLFKTTLNHGDKALLLHEGEPVETFALLLNTVLAIGNDQLCILAKLHAQCELHAWVDGPDRAWLADIIDQGRASGLYREGAGWENVATLLRNSGSAPVVTSYSITESFPNSYVASWAAPVDEDGEPNDDAWYDLSHGQRWDLAIAGLRADRSVPPLSPQILRAPFGHGLTMWDIFNQATHQKVGTP